MMQRNGHLNTYINYIDGISSANLECVCTHCRQCKSHLLTITEVRCVSGTPFFLLLLIVKQSAPGNPDSRKIWSAGMTSWVHSSRV